MRCGPPPPRGEVAACDRVPRLGPNPARRSKSAGNISETAFAIAGESWTLTPHMSDSSHPAPEHIEEEFSLPLFLTTIVGSLAALLGLFWLAAPQSVWLTQVSTTAGKFIAAFLVMHLFACFVEYFFHRYVLHKPVVPFLARFYRQHTLHHNLTRIGRRRTPSGRELPVVEHIFPITQPSTGRSRSGPS